jgi:3-mercaptopyruvate sulfurtransferase SseA
MIQKTSRKQIWYLGFWQMGAIVIVSVTLAVLINQFRPDRLPLVSDWPPESRLNLETDESMVIALEEAKDNFHPGSAIFLDARSPEHYEQGHIRGARNLPWEAVEKYFDAVMEGIPKDALIISYCDGESCTLSKDLTQELFYRGYDNARVLVNGWSLWVEHHLPVEKGPLPGGF